MKCLIISHALSPGRMRLTHVKAGAKESLSYISAPRWSILHAGMYIYYFFFFLFWENGAVLEALKCLLF